MATVKLVLLSSNRFKRNDGTFPLAVRVTINRVPHAIRIGYSIELKYWNKDESNLKIRPKHPNYNILHLRIDELKIKAFQLMLELDRQMPNWTFKQFKRRFLEEPERVESFFSYLEKIRKQCINNGQASKAKTLNDLKNNLLKYPQYPESFSDITIIWLRNLQMFYRNKGIVGRNYFKEIRTLYNQAIMEGLAKKEDYPFGQWGFKLPAARKKDRGLSLNDLKLLLNYKSSVPSKNRAIKLWLFMFYSIGMDWMVVCNLKVKNVQNGRIDYTRSKTGKSFSIKILPEAHEIINELQSGVKPNDLLFGIIPQFVVGNRMDEKQYADKKRDSITTTLSRIKKELGIMDPLTVRTARYTWASIARNDLNVTTELIQDSLGHSDIKVTQGYANNRENKAVDDLNEKISHLF